MNGLNHNALTCSAVPIPPWERPLQTVEAQPYFNVSQASLVLEGIVFDRNNNLLFVDVATGRVFKLTPERQLSIVLKENSFGASGLAVHKDGRIFIASVGDMQRGSVRAIEPNGTREQMIVAACEDSLRRLKTDHIDVYQMHHIDRHTPWEEIWQAMELLVQQGKVLYIGSSNFAGWDIATAQSVATARHFLGLVAEQSLYNLTARTIELEVIPACRHFGLGLIPWSPLAGGLLGGVLKKMASGRRARPAFARLIEQYRPQLEAYEGLCKDLGETPSDVALAWLLQNPVVTAPLIGPRTVEQLQQALHATTVTLSDDTMSCLDEIWPGPGGEAPQAYAW
ncbi:putative aldo/keto reductase [Klebsiella pneumoniae]|nr:putative aldo/keto reductase [Klebsiella pneumoniae]